MRIFGISMVRNNVDTMRLNILHHLSLGIDKLLIVDNGSSDGTDRILRELSKDSRVEWRRDNGPYRQSQITTELAREAFRNGADWVVPIDADEFWYAENKNFRQILSRSSAPMVQVQVVNFVQRRKQKNSSPEALRYMTRRVASAIGPSKLCRELVESQQIAFIEMAYPPKWISRPSEMIEIAAGNHRVLGIEGSSEATDEIVCLHAPLRSRTELEAKAISASRLDGGGFKPRQAWHMRRWQRLLEESSLEREWAANSYQDDCLDVYREKHKVIFDPRLRDAVESCMQRHPQGGLLPKLGSIRSKLTDR